MSVYKYYLKADSRAAIDAALTDTVGGTQSTKECTIVWVPEPLTIVGGTDDEPIYSDPSGFVHCNVYSTSPLAWPEVVTLEEPETPWSDLT